MINGNEMYYQGWVFITILSLLMLAIGFWKLYRRGRRRRFFVLLAGVLGFVAMSSVFLGITDEHLRFWVALASGIVFPIGLTMVFFFNPEATSKGPESDLRRKRARSILKGIVMISGMLVWLYGVWHPDAQFTCVILMCAWCLFFGRS